MGRWGELLEKEAPIPTPEEINNEKMEWADVFTQAAQNLPADSASVIKDLATPFLHPIQTAQAVGGIVEGGVQKLIPGEQGKEERFDAMVDLMKDQYGGIENIKRTIAEHPAQVAVDIGSFLIPGGKAIQVAGTASKGAKVGRVVSKIGEITQKAGTLTDITGVGMKTVKKGVGLLIPKDAPSKLFISSAKMKSSLGITELKKLARTALDNEVMLTFNGIFDLKKKIFAFNDKITDVIDKAATKGKIVPMNSLVKGFEHLENIKIGGKPITARRMAKNIREQHEKANTVFKEIEKKRTVLSKIVDEKGQAFKRTETYKELTGEIQDLTLKETQELKQAIYKETGSFYSKSTESPASVKAQHLIAKNAKEALENYFPEIKQLNKKEGDLIALMKEIEKSANNISKRDIFNFGLGMKGATGGVIGGPGGAAIGIGLGLLDKPTIKNKLAIVLNNIKNKNIPISPKSAFTRLGYTQAGGIVNEDK